MALPSDKQAKKLYLGVPLSLQSNGYSCVPHCLKMVLDYLHIHHNQVVVPELDEIMKAVGTTELGTEFGSIENINRLLEKSVPSVEFRRDSSYPQWETIIKDIEETKPVILWVELKDQIGRPYGHSVVVEGYTNNKVLYKDPLHGDLKEGIDTFLSKWDAMDRYTIRVKVDERAERKLTEYI
ncbi:MAG: C39 family peptidase [Candidatus Bathyarchaeota archaeon]